MCAGENCLEAADRTKDDRIPAANRLRDIRMKTEANPGAWPDRKPPVVFTIGIKYPAGPAHSQPPVIVIDSCPAGEASSASHRQAYGKPLVGNLSRIDSAPFIKGILHRHFRGGRVTAAITYRIGESIP